MKKIWTRKKKKKALRLFDPTTPWSFGMSSTTEFQSLPSINVKCFKFTSNGIFHCVAVSTKNIFILRLALRLTVNLNMLARSFKMLALNMKSSDSKLRWNKNATIVRTTLHSTNHSKHDFEVGASKRKRNNGQLIRITVASRWCCQQHRHQHISASISFDATFKTKNGAESCERCLVT